MTSAIEQKSYLIKGGDPLTRYAPRIIQLGGPLDQGLSADALRLMKEDFGNNPALDLIVSKISRENFGPSCVEFSESFPRGPKGELREFGYLRRISGSNVFIRYALGPRVKKLYGPNIQLISPAISEQLIEQAYNDALRLSNMFFAGDTNDTDLYQRLQRFYEDLGVVAYKKAGPNEQLKRHLIDQARERGIPIEFPILFYRLKTVKDDRFVESRGLRLDLDDAEDVAFHAPVLAEKPGCFDFHDPNLTKLGLPLKVDEFIGPQGRKKSIFDNPERRLYVADSGLRDFVRHKDLNLVADNPSLLISGDAGRISFLVGEIPQNLEDTIAKSSTQFKQFQNTFA